jgi:hypothetical protein
LFLHASALSFQLGGADRPHRVEAPLPDDLERFLSVGARRVTFDLIVFDWDGTLMDSEARIVNCLQAAFGDLGLPPPAREAARDVIGLGLDEAILRLHPGRIRRSSGI